MRTCRDPHLVPCVDGSGLARTFFTSQAWVGAAMCSAGWCGGADADSSPSTSADHESVVAVLGNLPPDIFVVAKCLYRVPNFLVIDVGRRSFGVDLDRRLQTGYHDRLRERTQLRARGDQTLQGFGVA